MNDLAGKVIIVTGGNSGLGFEYPQYFSKMLKKHGDVPRRIQKFKLILPRGHQGNKTVYFLLL